ncbi:hypothetical protein EJB05_15867 [Eragrostis curvula]|uniref:WAT1-related protein n=1 Tax=Eragrostis curvula TaxID=38414 RepID=A0A5J9VDC5_9POAL|nr:hypothetical protein EJB05_15867 [Eragrostis curvula]
MDTGNFLAVLAAVMWALWAVRQPLQLIERDFSRWKLGLDVGLVAIAVTFAISCYVQIWLIDKMGPVFLNMTVPLTLVFTILLTFLLGEAVSLGSVISGVLMVGGLYNVLWGKRIEQVATSMQEDYIQKSACSDLEEQENAAPVPNDSRFDRDST